jgi:cystathionine gamma-synthase
MTQDRVDGVPRTREESVVEPGAVRLDSWVVAGGRPGEPGQSLNVPIFPASNFLLGAGRTYSREHGTPTIDAFERLMGGLEGGSAVAFSSGMAAAGAVLDRLPAGASIVLADDCYQGVSAVVRSGEEKGRWRVRRLPPTETQAWIQALDAADLLWLESTSNPFLTVADLATICAAPRRPGTQIAVDNTLPTPFGVRPLGLGADVVVHSATKLIGGHSDLLAGVVVAADPEVAKELRDTRTRAGSVPGALETYLVLRGARTLALRIERAQGSARVLAERLAGHAEVERVRYPGLPTHTTHEVAARVLEGFGAMVSFDVRGDAARADRVCSSVGLIRHATSLGGVETTLERRGLVPGQEHLPPTLLRMSVGCENVEDLWRDLEGALAESAA